MATKNAGGCRKCSQHKLSSGGAANATFTKHHGHDKTFIKSSREARAGHPHNKTYIKCPAGGASDRTFTKQSRKSHGETFTKSPHGHGKTFTKSPHEHGKTFTRSPQETHARHPHNVTYVKCPAGQISSPPPPSEFSIASSHKWLDTHTPTLSTPPPSPPSPPRTPMEWSFPIGVSTPARDVTLRSSFGGVSQLEGHSGAYWRDLGQETGCFCLPDTTASTHPDTPSYHSPESVERSGRHSQHGDGSYLGNYFANIGDMSYSPPPMSHSSSGDHELSYALEHGDHSSYGGIGTEAFNRIFGGNLSIEDSGEASPRHHHHVSGFSGLDDHSGAHWQDLGQEAGCHCDSSDMSEHNLSFYLEHGDHSSYGGIGSEGFNKVFGGQNLPNEDEEDQELSQLEDINVFPPEEHEEVSLFKSQEDEHLNYSSGMSVMSVEEYQRAGGDMEVLSAANQEAQFEVYLPLMLNEVMAPRTTNWNELRSYTYSEAIGDLLEREIEEINQLQELLRRFHTSRRERLSSETDQSP